jgi:hypothetical protein
MSKSPIQTIVFKSPTLVSLFSGSNSERVDNSVGGSEMDVIVVKFDPMLLLDEPAFFADLILVLVNLSLNSLTVCLRYCNQLCGANLIYIHNSSLASGEYFLPRRV